MRTCGSAIESADVVAGRRTVADLLLPVEPLHVRRQVSEHNGRSFRTSDRLSSLSGSVAATESPAHHVTDLTLAPHPARLGTPMASNGQRSPRTSPVPSALRCRLTSAQSSSLSSLRSIDGSKHINFPSLTLTAALAIVGRTAAGPMLECAAKAGGIGKAEIKCQHRHARV